MKRGRNRDFRDNGDEYGINFCQCGGEDGE